MNRTDARNQLFHLFERVGEPIYFSPRGRNGTRIMFEVDKKAIKCPEMFHASQMVQQGFSSSMQPSERVQIRMPKMPMEVLKRLEENCPKSVFYSHFNPKHQKATQELMTVFKDEAKKGLSELISMCCYCRDQSEVNCNLWINAFATVLLTSEATKDLRVVPAAWEIMPDQFFSAAVMAIAARQADLPVQDRGLIVMPPPTTGSNQNPENKLAYWREDPGLNNHHWHWHLVYRTDEKPPKPKGRRKGELFYYMHHDILARYNAERLGHDLQRVMPLSLDDNPTLKEGYFAGLFQTNSFQSWGTRQAETKLTDVERKSDPNIDDSLRAQMTMTRVRECRQRINHVIDTGMYRKKEGDKVTKHKLDIDVLGDIMEASAFNPDPQYYGEAGFHNVVHSMISLAHDPKYKHLQAPGPMFETTTAMRDPIFYRWHTNIDIMFDNYKKTQQPYQDKGGEFPLAWEDVEVREVITMSTKSSSRANLLTTFWMESHADLSRGLDFFRTDMEKLGGIFYKFTHLNYDPFNYTISVENKSRSEVWATVRIYMAPRLDQNMERFSMIQQRRLFFEMDKFVETLRPGNNNISRSSEKAAVAIPWEQTFRDLERGLHLPSPEQSICGCGWPQHLLLPRGNAQGQIFDLVVFLTNAKEDQVPGTEPPAIPKCRESLSFCGRLNQPYPDSKPMGYPWDRVPFTVQNSSGTQQPVKDLDEYVSRLPNMKTIQVRIQHHPDKKVTREDGGPPKGTREIMANPAMTPVQMCPTSNAGNRKPDNANPAFVPRPGQGPFINRPSGGGSFTESRAPDGKGPPQWENSGWPTGPWASAGGNSGSSGWGKTNPWYPGPPQQQPPQNRPNYHQRRGREESPDSSPDWARVSNSRPGSPQWSWDG